MRTARRIETGASRAGKLPAPNAEKYSISDGNAGIAKFSYSMVNKNLRGPFSEFCSLSL